MPIIPQCWSACLRWLGRPTRRVSLWVSVVRLAGDPGAVLLLMAMGYDMLSMNGSSLLKVKAVVRGARYSELGELLDRVMKADTADEVKLLLRAALVDFGLEKLAPPSQ